MQIRYQWVSCQILPFNQHFQFPFNLLLLRKFNQLLIKMLKLFIQRSGKNQSGANLFKSYKHLNKKIIKVRQLCISKSIMKMQTITPLRIASTKIKICNNYTSKNNFKILYNSRDAVTNHHIKVIYPELPLINAIIISGTIKLQ